MHAFANWLTFKRRASYLTNASLCILVILCYRNFFAAEAQKNFAKCSPKLLIAEAINDGVTNGIPILEPFGYLSEFYQQFLEPLASSGHPHFSSTNITSKVGGEKR